MDLQTQKTPVIDTVIPNGKAITGAEAIILSLLAEGVDTIFGYPGGAIMPFYDELYKYSHQLRHILVRHEQGAVHAAQGYARMRRTAGVCVATSGPGATNLLTGIADALMDSTPLVCITGQVGKHLLGTDAFQETDVVGISMPVTKWNYQVTKAADIPEAIAKAFYVAQTGRPGPVLLDITKNAQFEAFHFQYKPCTKVRGYHPKLKPNESNLQAAADLINHAKKPMLLVGHGILIAKGQEVLKEFVEKTGIPVASTLLGLSAFPNSHPLYVGYLGMHGNYGPNIKTNEADLLIAVGMRFDDRVTGDTSRYAKQAKIIHIEIDPAEIDKNIKTDVAILADAKEALQQLIPRVEKREYSEWIAEFKVCDKIEYEKVLSKDFSTDSQAIKMAEVIEQINQRTQGKAVIVTDVGQHQMVATRYYQFEQTESNVTSGGLGTMGFALPAAIGAKLGSPERQVIAIIGDGGFQMTLQELGVIAQYQIPVKILVLNNNFLGMVRQWQELFFEERYSATELINPDFIKIVDGFGIKAKKVSERAALAQAVSEWLENDDEAYFLEVVVQKDEKVYPMIPTGESVSNILLE